MVTIEAIELQQSYIREGVVSNKSLDDALHVACLTRCIGDHSGL